MLDFMDEIVDGVKFIAERVIEVAAYALIIIADIAILITTPIWIIPYVIIRERKGRGKK